MNKVEKITEDALKIIVEDITYHVFDVIQNDYTLMQQYIEQVGKSDTKTVNRTIGKYVKKRLNLTNLGQEENVESSLIKSYKKHGLPE